MVVDVGKLLSQLERSEQARFDADSRLSATNKILSNIRETEGKQTAIKEKLQVNYCNGIIRPYIALPNDFCLTLLLLCINILNF